MTDSSELDTVVLPQNWRELEEKISNDDFILNKIFGVDGIDKKLGKDEYCVFFTHSGSDKYFVFIKAFEFYDTTKHRGIDTIATSYIDKGYFPIMDNKGGMLKIKMSNDYKSTNTTGLRSWSVGKNSIQNRGYVEKVDDKGKITFYTEDIEVVVSKSCSFYKTFYDMINGNTGKEGEVREYRTKDDDYKKEVEEWLNSSKEGNGSQKDSGFQLSNNTIDALEGLVYTKDSAENCKKFENSMKENFDQTLENLRNERPKQLKELYLGLQQQSTEQLEELRKVLKEKNEEVKALKQQSTEQLEELRKKLEEKNKETEGLKQQSTEQLEELRKKLEEKNKELEEKNKELEEKNEKVNRLLSENEDLKGIGRQNVVDKMDKFLFGKQKTDRPEDAKKLVLESEEKSKKEVSKFSEDINKIIKQHVSENPQTTDQIIASCYNEVMTNRKINTEPWQVIKKDGFFEFKKDEESEFAVIGNDLCEVLPILTRFKCLPSEKQKLPYETNGVKICSVEEAVKGKIDVVKRSVEEVVNVRTAISSKETRGSSGTGITR